METVGERPSGNVLMFRLREIRDSVFEECVLEEQELKESKMGLGEAKCIKQGLRTYEGNNRLVYRGQFGYCNGLTVQILLQQTHLVSTT